jgi:hypothetical protein
MALLPPRVLLLPLLLLLPCRYSQEGSLAGYHQNCKKFHPAALL